MKIIARDITKWSSVLSLHEFDEYDYDATGLIETTANYLEMRPVDQTAEAQTEASARLGDAIDSSQPFAIEDAGDDSSKEEMAKLVKMLFAAPPQRASREPAAVMSAAPAGAADDGDDFITFKAEQGMATTPLRSKSRNSFASDDTVWT